MGLSASCARRLDGVKTMSYYCAVGGIKGGDISTANEMLRDMIKDDSITLLL